MERGRPNCVRWFATILVGRSTGVSTLQQRRRPFKCKIAGSFFAISCAMATLMVLSIQLLFAAGSSAGESLSVHCHWADAPFRRRRCGVGGNYRLPRLGLKGLEGSIDESLERLRGGSQLHHDTQHTKRRPHDVYASTAPELDALVEPLSRGGAQQQRALDGPVLIMELYENEYYDNDCQAWVGGGATIARNGAASSARWTQPHTFEPSPYTPPTLPPPGGYQYTDNWKIDVTGTGPGGSKDKLGWEYLSPLVVGADGSAVQRRRRRWLRPVEIIQPPPPPITEKPPIPTTTPMTPTKTKKRRKLRSPTPLRSLQESFNFKGYGVTLVKSLLVKETCGMSFRLPLSMNFDWFERRPALPSITTSCGIYYPWCASIFLNVSVNVDVLKFLFWAGVVRLWRVVLLSGIAVKLAVLLVWRVFTLPFRVVGVIFTEFLTGFGKKGKRKQKRTAKATKKKARVESTVEIWGHSLPALPRNEIRYSSNVEERIGTSLSCRITKTGGYEFRVDYWHIFLPTLQTSQIVAGKVLELLISKPSQILLRFATKKKKKSASKRNSAKDAAASDSEDETVDDELGQTTPDGALTEWVRQHTGSLGLGSGFPTPNPPHCFCNAVLALSAFYNNELFRDVWKGLAYPLSIWGHRRRSRFPPLLPSNGLEGVDGLDGMSEKEEEPELVEKEHRRRKHHHHHHHHRRHGASARRDKAEEENDTSKPVQAGAIAQQ